MLNSNTRKSLDDKAEDRMRWHLFIGGVFCFTSVLTPFSSVYRCWEFQGGNSQIAYQEYYIFGIRVARRRL